MDLPFYNPTTLTLAEAARLGGGEVYREGRFENLGMFRSAGTGLLTIFYDERFRPQFEANLHRFSAVVTTRELAPGIPEILGVLLADDPLDLFLRLHETLSADGTDFYSTPSRPTVVSPSATIHPTAVIAEDDVLIGDGVVVEPFAVIGPRTSIGAGTYVGPHVVLGGLGFEMRRLDGLRCLSHAGGVVIGPGCHLLAHSAVARATFGGATVLGELCKLDQFVHIGHAATLGPECRLASGAGVAGTTRLGRNVWVGPNAIIGNSLEIGDDAWVALGAAVVQDVVAGGRIGGPFSRPMPR
jgi:UDP-3-O-[3-hydroxymyristoyl] glucosamine N-acyltransferase